MVSFTSSNDDDYRDEYHLADAIPQSQNQLPDSSFNHYDKIFSDSHKMMQFGITHQ